MGLFDYVKCEPELPDGFTGELQTKDFPDPCMLQHVITKDGRLMECVLLRVEQVPKAERRYPDAPDNDLRSIYGSLRSVTGMRDANYHGMLNFYGTDAAGGWHEYNAKFTDGQLVEIQAVATPPRAPDDPPPSAPGRQRSG